MAKTGASVTRAMPIRMLYAYSTFDIVTYSQNKPTIVKNCRRLKPPAYIFPDELSCSAMEREPSAIAAELRRSRRPPGTNPYLPGTTSKRLRRREP